MLTVSSWCGLSGVVDGVAEKVVSESAIEDMEALGRPKGKVTGGGGGGGRAGGRGQMPGLATEGRQAVSRWLVAG